MHFIDKILFTQSLYLLKFDKLKPYIYDLRIIRKNRLVLGSRDSKFHFKKLIFEIFFKHIKVDRIILE